MEKLYGVNLDQEPMELELEDTRAPKLDALNNLSQVTFVSIKQSLRNKLEKK